MGRTKKNLVNSQLTNFLTYQMYLRQFLNLAENVFEFKNMPKFIDTSYLNKTLLLKGSIAFFVDEVMGLLALPFVNIGSLDVYGRPTSIEVIGLNGYTRTLKQGEFVIMYDNNGRYPLNLDICQYAERYSLLTRVIDTNVKQQRTPRLWKTKTEQVRTIQDLVNNVDGDVDTVIGYDNIDLDETQAILAPAPFVSDKLQEEKDKIWSEFLRLIGISNMSYEKKERNIKDEISAMQGGTVASRYSRFEPRKKAIEEINEKFAKYLSEPIEVRFYDGLPDSNEKFEEYIEDFSDEEMEGLEND